MNERIYRTPRTYGSPTGYDMELTHYPSNQARLSELVARSMAYSEAYRDFTPVAFVERACDIAAEMLRSWESRGWMLPVEDAPGMDKNYGIKARGAADPQF